jgi:DNA-binding MarR family transcriptional regulator
MQNSALSPGKIFCTDYICIYIYFAMTATSLPSLACMCASFRRAARALTQLYEEALRPLGLRATQFTVLQALSRTGEVSQGELGRILAMDSTTLTRTLEIMVRHRWIEKRYGKDRRERLLRLGKPGHEQLKRALPVWQNAQAQLRRRIGDAGWRELLNSTNKLVNDVTE